MAKTLSLVGGLPQALMEKLIALRNEAQQILAEQKRLVPVVHREVRLVNGKPQEKFTERMQPKVRDPRLAVRVQMSDDKTTQIELHLVKPAGEVDPYILTLDASEYAELSEQIEARNVSWEAFFDQVVQ
jgi:hypothetical protein